MAWVTKAALSSLADVSGAALVSGQTQTRDAVDARVQVGAASAVADAVANSEVVKDAAIAAMEDAALQAELTWNKPQATISDELAALSFGSHPIPNTNVSAALGLPVPRFGNLTVIPNGSSGRIYLFKTNHVSAQMPYEEWELATHGDGTIRMPWTKTWPINFDTIDSSNDQWRVSDQEHRVALAIDARGNTRIGATTHREATPGFRVLDSDGRMAFEVDADGTTHIFDLAGDGSSGVDTVHVFVAAGQSNMSGRGQPLVAPTSARILQFGANNRVIEEAPIRLDMVDAPAGTSPALFFAHNYLGSQPSNVAVLLIPAAKGGTTFTGSPESPAAEWTWTKGAAPAPEFALYERSVEQTLDAIAAAKAAGYRVVLKGVLWHQGEGNGGDSPSVYSAALDALIANYRADLGDAHLPVMIGQMCPEGIDLSTGRQGIAGVHESTPTRVTRTGYAAATYDAHNPGDTTHFSTAGTSYLGDTFAAAYLQALGNVHV